MKFIKFLTLIFLFILSIQYSYSIESIKQATGIESLSDLYDTPPDIANCNYGILKEAEKQKVLDLINYIRALHKLKPVIYDYNGDVKASKAALVCLANGALSHQPPAPGIVTIQMLIAVVKIPICLSPAQQVMIIFRHQNIQ